ncbi:ARM repeat-containing protein [Trichodelitschia bisporula]|uniref:AP complex subunit beta n=1 Tax=Trichodelitschia bisporula TaxID=703511 RepID=A0A6G1HKU9_9PEZI|nr:ARM repeat-containing protein [Trichodelitschia bisporula]
MESISRISSMLEAARDLTLEAARDASTRKPTTRPLPALALKKLLDSRRETDILEGLRKVISLSYQKAPTLQFFSHIVKNIASPNLEVKKLVYAYLVQHAEEAPDTALLSINTIQKSLSDADPRLRALALRTMSSIRVPVISQIVALGIKRGVGDMSPYVRRAAALAIPKCYRLDPGMGPELVRLIAVLLGDKQYYVAGAAVVAFLEVCPERIELVHPHYKALVRKLVDMDEWGQLATMQMMLGYARACFPRKTRWVKTAKTRDAANPTKGFYDSESSDNDEDEGEEVTILDPDLDFFLRAATPLLHSRNPAVILAVARCYIYLGDSAYTSQIPGPLISLLRAPADIQHIALHNITQIALSHAALFAPYTSHFLLRSTDPIAIKTLKLDLLTLLFPPSPPTTRSLILAEISHFTAAPDPVLVRAAVRALGACATAAPTPALQNHCLRLLLKQLASPDPHLVAAALEVVRHLIQRAPEKHARTIVRLAKHLDVLSAPRARAAIVWLVGEYAARAGKGGVAPDVLRLLVRGWGGEGDEVRREVLGLGGKVYLAWLGSEEGKKALEGEKKEGGEGDEAGWGGERDGEGKEEKDPIPALFAHVLLLARYTPSYDLRDRARLLRALLANPQEGAQLASLLMLAPKPAPLAESRAAGRAGFTLGSASLVVGVGNKGKTLDDWLASEEEEEEEEEEESEESGEEDEEEESEEESEDESDSEEDEDAAQREGLMR